MRPRAWLLTIALASACSPHLRYQALSTLFDGVTPPPGTELRPTRARGARTESGELRTADRVEVVRHPPFADRNCKGCHGQGPVEVLRAPGQTYCLECHDGETAPNPAAGLRRLHGPVAAVECLACHEPHQAPRPHLLKRPGAALCTECHEEKAARPGVRTRGPVCTDCHLPHGGRNRFMLRLGEVHHFLPRQDGEEPDELLAGGPFCAQCHDGHTAPDPTAGKAWLHGPAAAGDCLVCHLPHHPGDERHFLRRSGDALCTFCHEAVSRTPEGAHAQVGQQACLECHDPHGAAAPPTAEPGGPR